MLKHVLIVNLRMAEERITARAIQRQRKENSTTESALGGIRVEPEQLGYHRLRRAEAFQLSTLMPRMSTLQGSPLPLVLRHSPHISPAVIVLEKSSSTFFFYIHLTFHTREHSASSPKCHCVIFHAKPTEPICNLRPAAVPLTIFRTKFFLYFLVFYFSAFFPLIKF